MKNYLVELLNTDSLLLTEAHQEAIRRFCELVGEANEALSLVSGGDAVRLEEVHVADSLSLAPWVLRHTGPSGWLLDIGSGGGFPAIPIKIALSGLRVTLVERSAKKCGFLRRIVEALRLTDVTIVEGEFPYAVPGLTPDVVTARAVEKSEKVRRQILRFLPETAVFFCQMPDSVGPFPPAFHVEHIDDLWSERGLRRGTLHLVTHKPPAPEKAEGGDQQ